MKKQVFHLSALALLCAIGSVSGQKKKETKKEREILEEVVVTDSRFEIKRENSGKVVQKITPAQIEAYQGRNVVDLINSISGIEISGSRSAQGQNLGYYVRGGRSNEVVILIDGIQVSDPLQNNYDLRLLNLDQIESIEILKGASSTLYGAGASTAVIDIKLKRAKNNNIAISLSTNIGSNNSQIAGDKGYITTNDLNISGKPSTIFDYKVAIGHKKATGFSASLPAEGDTTTFKEDPFERINSSIDFGFKLSEQFYISTFTSYFKTTHEFDGGSFVDAENTTVSENFRVGFAPKYTYTDGVIQLNAAYSTFDIDNVKTTYPNKNKGTNVIFDLFGKHNFTEKISGIIGVNYQYNEIETSSIPWGQTELTPTVYAENPVTILADPYANIVYVSGKGLNLNLGARLNTHSNYGSQFVYNINPSYTLSYGNKGYSKLFASYSTAFVTPSLQELYASWGNTDLTPQESLTFEGGFESKLNKILLNMTYYKRKLEHVIFYNGTTNKMDNGGDASVKGLELGLTYKPNNNLSFHTNYTYTETENRAIRIPKNKLNFSASYNLKEKTNFLLSYQYNG
ncbi:TonB-dependent receptor plug domain-containing protein, partial [Bacteroidota bacterium]